MEENNYSWVGWIILVGLVWGGFALFGGSESSESENSAPSTYKTNELKTESIKKTSRRSESVDGYEWAEDNYVSSYEECEYKFGGSYEEDECNEYVTENVSGYAWAEYYDASTFEECQYQFGSGYEEDDCNEYVKDNYLGHNTFNGYDCTEDCSGHEAGYEWAEDNDIYDEYDCGGNSSSFIEGCISYVEDYY